ncbi:MULTISPECIES: MobQ family relaxase [Lachnospiraceae]|jgi:hypothetical protein|uniref:MobQ family relaxase n=1 Tax=Lachnospiraceae TaxID=186803 RepID=UPI00156FACF4|nr:MULTISPECIES: MobQ family relaxase [Lachnospiraceae]MCB5918578.1 MobA/MobL family protein [Lachnospiraceae bacterium 210521-DFI.1.105]MCB6298835.1 MobA/MobL family protein [Mediterraneibacter faecis]MCB6445503.1 MobA/MobL family protein [Mediterraneibacter faecis]MCQ5257471.1 MobA/MobL family protein [Mediterraneibacter faecis]MCQ5260432.1 MobA/MobL family protein [Mediterraneibacter faecis]
MALYHFSIKQVSRGKGQTVVNSAAYISGQKLYNDYYGQTHDYTKKSGVVFTEILTPEYVPERLTDRETLWNEVEKIEKGKRAQLAYSFDIALQNELTLDENIELARTFCQEQFVARGMIVDLAVHEGKSKNEDEPDNPHFHVLAPIRSFTEEGSWGNKQRREYVLGEDGNRIKDAKGKDIFNAVSTTGWNDPELLKEWRRAWTEKVNEKFRECHMAARIDHRSYKEQGIDLIPTIHEGYEVRAMEKKGIKTVIGELNRAIRQFNQMFISLKESIQWMKTAYEEMKVELDRRQNPTLLESLQDYYDKKTQGRPPFPNFYAEMKRRGKNLSNLQEFAKSINYLQTHKIETMEDLQERIDELNGVVSVSKKEISEKREQLKKLENLQKMAEVIKTNQPLIDEYNHFFFPKKREKYYQQHKKEINYYRKCERELKQYLDKNGKVPTDRWKREKEELRSVIEELKADNQPYQDELAFVKKVQSCADIARRDREMEETDSSGRSEEKREKQVKFPAFHAVQTEVNLEEKNKVEQQTVSQTEQKPEKKTSIRKQLAEKKKECEERDAKQQTVRKKRNYDMSL